MAHLFTGEPAPWEYIELIMCRDVYHCPPSLLPDLDTIVEVLEMLSIEAKVRQMRSK